MIKITFVLVQNVIAIHPLHNTLVMSHILYLNMYVGSDTVFMFPKGWFLVVVHGHLEDKNLVSQTVKNVSRKLMTLANGYVGFL